MKETGISTLLRSRQTVFTSREISLLWRETDPVKMARRIHHYVHTHKLIRLRRGIYAKSEDYDPFELAGKLYTPSYIGFETVLLKAGVIFQLYTTIFAASYLTREIKVAEQTIFYRKIKNDILTNSAGVEEKNGYAMASPERAFLDAVFNYKDYHFDNLRPLDWDKIHQLAPIYRSKALVKRVREYQELSKI